MFRTIIVPLDGIPESEGALLAAREQAGLHEATLVLIRVVPRPEPCTLRVQHGGPNPLAPAWSTVHSAADKEAAMQYLTQAMTLYELDPATELVVRVGEPYTQIMVEATSRIRPLIVTAAGPACTTHDPVRHTGMRIRLLRNGRVPILDIGDSRTFLRDRPLLPVERVSRHIPYPAHHGAALDRVAAG